MAQLARTVAVPVAMSTLASYVSTRTAVPGLKLDSMIDGLRDGASAAVSGADQLAALVAEAEGICCPMKRAEFFLAKVKPLLVDSRHAVDGIESLVPAREWPLPTYAQMLFHQD